MTLRICPSFLNTDSLPQSVLVHLTMALTEHFTCSAGTRVSKYIYISLDVSSNLVDLSLELHEQCTPERVQSSHLLLQVFQLCISKNLGLHSLLTVALTFS